MRQQFQLQKNEITNNSAKQAKSRFRITLRIRERGHKHLPKMRAVFIFGGIVIFSDLWYFENCDIFKIMIFS